MDRNSTKRRRLCMIEIFRGGRVVDGEGVAVKDVVGVWVIKGSFQKHLKTGGG